MGIFRFPYQKYIGEIYFVDDKVVKVTMSKSKYDHIGAVLKAIFLQDATGFDKLSIPK